MSLKFVPKCPPINNIPALDQTGRQAIICNNDGYIPDAFMHRSATLS